MKVGVSQEALAERVKSAPRLRWQRELGISALGQLPWALGVSLAEFFDPLSSSK